MGSNITATSIDGNVAAIDIGLHESIEQAIKLRSDALALETQANDMKKEANSILEPSFIVGNVKTVRLDGVGEATYAEGSKTKTFKKEILIEKLLIAGVSADIINSAIEDATVEGKPRAATIRFTPWANLKGVKK